LPQRRIRGGRWQRAKGYGQRRTTAAEDEGHEDHGGSGRRIEKAHRRRAADREDAWATVAGLSAADTIFAKL